MTYVPANASKDLWAVLGGLVAIAVGVFWWVRREERGFTGPDQSSASEADGMDDPPVETGPSHGDVAC